MKNNSLLILILLMMFKLTSAQWSSIYTSSSNSFYGACRSIDTDTCFVADESGKIYRTIDGGC